MPIKCTEPKSEEEVSSPLEKALSFIQVNVIPVQKPFLE